MEDGDFRPLAEQMSHLNANQSAFTMLEPRGANSAGNTEQALVRHPLDAYQQSSIQVSLQADATVDENDNLEGAYAVVYPSTTEIIFSESEETSALQPGSDTPAELSTIVIRLARNDMIGNDDMFIICFLARITSSRQRPITSAAATTEAHVFQVYPEPVDARTK